MHFDETIYRLFSRNIYVQAYRRLDDHGDSEDVVQNSFMRLSAYRADSIANVGAMLQTIARNLILDHARTAGRYIYNAPLPDHDIPTPEPSQEHVMLQRERVEQVVAIIDRMPEMRRTVFIMRRLHGKSAKEVAGEMNISAAAVDSHVARAVLILHKEMSALERHV